MGSNRFTMTPREIERGDHTDALDRSADRLQALAWMLFTAIREGTMEQHADAIASILENEAAMIASISDAVAELVSENRDHRSTLIPEAGLPERVAELREAIFAEKLRDGMNPATIAAAMNMQTTRLEEVMAKLKGIEQPPARRRAAS